MKVIFSALMMSCLCSCSLLQSTPASLAAVPTEESLIYEIRQININSDARIYLSQGDEMHIRIVSKAKQMKQIEVTQIEGHLNMENRAGQQLELFLTPGALTTINAKGSKLTLYANNNTSLNLNEIKADKVCLGLRGHGRIELARIEANQTSIKLNGHGHISIADIKAHALDVQMVGHGGIELAGSVFEQRVQIKGHGHYDAAALETHSAAFNIRGQAMATASVLNQPTIDQDEMSRLKVRRHAASTLASIPSSPFYLAPSLGSSISL